MEPTLFQTTSLKNDSATPAPDLLAQAVVPEHSFSFMEAMSGGKAFLLDGYLFLHAEDWLMGIGYPFKGVDSLSSVTDLFSFVENSFQTSSFEKAMERAASLVKARACWAIAPEFSEKFRENGQKKDAYYILPTDASPPAHLRRSLEKAREKLTVTESREFTAQHRALWAEFLERTSDMEAKVRNLYAGTEGVLIAAERRAKAGADFLDLRLLDARDSEGKLAASLLLDYSAKDFCSYIIGAHSRRHYTPHATDFLFAWLLENARKEGKTYLHLGLGVNEGIRRFKEKWGAKPLLSYEFSSWHPAGIQKRGREESSLDEAMGLLFSSSGLSKRQILESLPSQRSFAMAWEVRKGDAVSLICGTAHFFCYSFGLSFRKMFEPLDAILFEGPLDEDFLKAVENSGRRPNPNEKRVIATLSEEEIRRLERMVYGPQGGLARLLGLARPPLVDVRNLLSETRPWFAFFSLWSAFLERAGWSESVDLEAWRVARDMGKAVIAMENLEEQLASLESIPLERITQFFRQCDTWPARMKRNVGAYLAGDLGRLLGSSVEFPSRTEQVIDKRDARFLERMRPFIEAGNCAVFVGSAHLLGIRKMLCAEGFTLRQVLPGVGLKLKAFLRKKSKV